MANIKSEYRVFIKLKWWVKSFNWFAPVILLPVFLFTKVTPDDVMEFIVKHGVEAKVV